MSTLDKVLLETESHDVFLKGFMGKLATMTRVSNSISKGLDYEYNSSFSKHREDKNSCSAINRQLIGKLVNFCQGTSSRAVIPDDISDPYFYDLIVDAVDSLLDSADRSLSADSSSSSKDAIVVNAARLDKDRILMDNTLDIPKPQLPFLHEIDNSRETPFRPRLIRKYCSKIDYDGKPIHGTPPDLDVDDAQELGDYVLPDHYFPHPYEKEIQQADLPNVIPTGNPTAPDLAGRPFFYVDTPQGFAKMLPYLQRAKEIAIDLEHHSLRSFQGLTCVMQLSTREADFVIDALDLRALLPQLGQFFANPAIVKVFHGSDHDLMWLQRDFSLYVVSMFDTFDAATSLGLYTRSFAHLVHHYCQVKIPKTHQLSDWRQRPLPQDMKDYARGDTHYLLCVYDCIRRDLVNKLGATGLEETLLASRKRTLARYEKPAFRPMGYIALMKGNKASLTPAQEQALARLWDWRDQVARKEDESPIFIMSNAEMLRIATLVPRSPQEVLQASPLSAFTRAHLGEVVEVVRQAMQIAVPMSIPQRHSAIAGGIKMSTSGSSSSGTVFTFKPIIVADGSEVISESAPPESPRLLDTRELFMSAGWKSPEPLLSNSKSSTSRPWTPLILSALKPTSVTDESKARISQALEDLRGRLDPLVSNPNETITSVPSAPMQGSVMGATDSDSKMDDSQPVDSQGLEEIPQSFEDIYKLSGKTRKKNKLKKATAGTVEEVVVAADKGPGFDFNNYFAGEQAVNTDTSLESTLGVVRQAGWVQEEDVPGLREECTQVSEEAAMPVVRKSGDKSAGSGAQQQQLQQQQRMHSSHERHPTTGKAQAPPSGPSKSFDYHKLAGQQTMGALPSQQQLASMSGGGGGGGKGRGSGGGNRGGRGGGRGGRGEAHNPYLNTFSKN